MNRLLILVLGTTFLAASPAARGDAGVLIPANLQQDPDPRILSLSRLDVQVHIDHFHARVDMKAVFLNHTAQPLEGRYVLPLADRSAVEDFSVWQGEERLRGVIVEKQQGKRLFEDMVRRMIDPGLAESDDDPDKARDFTLRVAPIPPHGTARVEVTYSEDLRLTSDGALFTLPWKARRFAEQTVDELRLEVTAAGGLPLAEVKARPEGRLRWTLAPKDGGNRFVGIYQGRQVKLDEDFTVEMTLARQASAVDVVAYRDAASGGRQDLTPFAEGKVYRDTRGFFVVRAPIGSTGSQEPAPSARPRDVVFLFDTSLSMQWEKLERSFAALEYCLRRLRAEDRFAVVTFSEAPRLPTPALVPPTAANLAQALDGVRGAALGGATNLGAALEAGLTVLGGSPRAAADRVLLLISDGHPTDGEIGYQKLGSAFAAANRTRAAAVGKTTQEHLLARLFVLGVGDDAAGTLLDELAATADGMSAWLRDGSDPTFVLRTFFDKLGQSTLRDVALAVNGAVAASNIYPSVFPSIFVGSDALFYGRYARAGRATFTVRGRDDEAAGGQPGGLTLDFDLPEHDAARPWVGRGWARFRIEDLLGQIAVDGERESWVKEIIALAKEFRFVTPYTSFIAAPRALLRPRVIQPGDPVLRVKAPVDTRAVTALFPFGLTAPLRYLPAEDIWETRFVAPAWMNDGTYTCTLVLSDSSGRKTRETKSFVIDSRPPTIHAALSQTTARAGSQLTVRVHADADTRRIAVRLDGGPAFPVVWNAERKASLGVLPIPHDAATGRSRVIITAEDMAHNVASAELTLVLLGGGR